MIDEFISVSFFRYKAQEFSLCFYSSIMCSLCTSIFLFYFDEWGDELHRTRICGSNPTAAAAFHLEFAI